MISSGIDPRMAARQMDTQDMVRFKTQMDGLKKRLATTEGEKQKELKDACKNFEAVFISKLWQQMKSTVPKEGYLHNKQEDMYMSMFDREFAEKMADSGGIGLADMLYEQLSEKLKETSKDALTGKVAIKPLQEQPIALNNPGMALAGAVPPKTLEDWGGTTMEDGAQGGAVTTSADIVSGLQDQKGRQAPPSDVEVKAQLDALTRRLEAERIKNGLLENGIGNSGRAYDQGAGERKTDQVGRKIAKIG